MSERIQVFTRYSGSGSHRMSKPRRYCMALTRDEAVRICTSRNEARSAAQRRAGFFYEWTTEAYFNEAWR